MKSKPLTPLQLEIVRQIGIAVKGLDASLWLQAAISSWGDTLEDEEVLALLKQYNKASESKIRNLKSAIKS